MSKYGFGPDFVDENPDADFMPAVRIPHDPARAYFAESAEVLGYDGFATAVPALIATVAATYGPIVEVGAGFSSTPVLAAIARAFGREFFSLESDERWARIARYCRASFEVVDHGNALDVAETISYLRARLVFIDGGEPYSTRGRLLGILADLNDVEVVVAHDYDSANDTSEYLLSEGRWGHRHVFRKFFPYTLVCARDPGVLDEIVRSVEGGVK